MIKFITISVGVFYSIFGFSQNALNNPLDMSVNDGSISKVEKNHKFPTYFGIQVKSVLPTKFIRSQTASLSGGGFEASISQRPGFGFGAIVRTNISKLIAIESGINFTQRYFNLSVAIPDSNIYEEGAMTFIEYDIPINTLVFVQLSDEIFMNTSLGVAVTYKPSDTRVQIRTEDRHYFALYGLRDNFVGLDLNANIGFEYRTRESGFFYLGGSVRVPLAPLFNYNALYDHNSNSTLLSKDVSGSYLTFDFKYFFPAKK